MKNRNIRKIVTILSIPVAITSFLMVADVILPASKKDQATIIKKSISAQKSGRSYNIIAKGRLKYNEQVSHKFYKQVTEGDIIHISLSLFFDEMKKVELYHDGKLIETSKGLDIYAMGFFSLLFIAPLVIIIKFNNYLSDKIILYITLTVEIIGIAVLVKLLLVLFKIISKT